LAPEPIWPVPGSTTTPGVRPLSSASTEGSAVLAATSATFTVATDVPMERNCSPPAVPVTTTWLSSTARAESTKRTLVEPTFTVCVSGR
jgi:hypothetical protein